jgi:hypothetical protein
MGEIQSIYGCTILSFLGGIHWGLALKDPNPNRYIVSVLPSLVGFLSVQLIPHVPIQLLAQMFGFQSLLFYDYQTFQKQLFPKWFMKLRVFLTTVVTACLGLNCYAIYNNSNET